MLIYFHYYAPVSPVCQALFFAKAAGHLKDLHGFIKTVMRLFTVVVVLARYDSHKECNLF